jgi:hypothetical protein
MKNLYCICLAGTLLLIKPSNTPAATNGTNTTDIVQQLGTLATDLDRLNTNLTVAAQALAGSNDTTTVGADLYKIGGKFSQIGTLLDLTNNLSTYFTATNGQTNSPFESSLSTLEQDLSSFQKTPSVGELSVLHKLLKYSASNIQRIGNDIETTNIADLPRHLSDLGNDMTILSLRASGNKDARAREFIEANRQLALKDSASNSWGRVFFWTGAKLENPYTIDTQAKTLKSSGSSSDPFIEVSFSERYVMRNGEFDDLKWPWAKNHQDETPNDHRVHAINPLYDVFDMSGSFGYVFGGGNTSNTFSASTIAGGSDIYCDTSIGLPVLRYCSADYSLKQQFSLELGGGFVTDKQLDVIHPNMFVGGGYQGKFPNFVGTTNLPIYWLGRVGLGYIDQPTLMSTNVVVHNRGGLIIPAFHTTWVPSLGTTIILPLTSALNLQAGGNVYFASTPAAWNITIGVSLDLTKLAKGLGTTLGLSP